MKRTEEIKVNVCCKVIEITRYDFLKKNLEMVKLILVHQKKSTFTCPINLLLIPHSNTKVRLYDIKKKYDIPIYYILLVNRGKMAK